MSEQQHGEPPSPTVQALHSLLYSWEEDGAVTRKSRLLKAALQRDCKCLIRDYPQKLAQWLPQAFDETDEFLSITHEIHHFIKYCLLQKLKSSYDEPFISPFAGGMRGKEAQETDAQQPLAELKVGSINPGRFGLSASNTPTVLWWRLWEIARAGIERDLQIIFIPGGRFPPGAELPEGFPYSYIGP